MDDQEIADVKKIYKPGMDNLFAGIVLGLLAIGGGGCLAYFVAIGQIIETRGDMPFHAEKGPCWFTVLIVGTIGVGLVVLGVVLIFWMRSLSSLRVRLGQNGFSVTQKGTTRVFLWDAIRAVTETHLYERPPILKGVASLALPKMKSKSFEITRKDEEKFNFDGTSINGHLKLADGIKAETDTRGIPWEIVEEHG